MNLSVIQTVDEYVKETEKGYWITERDWPSYKKWIPKQSKKRFAYPTKKEALNNYILRTKRRMKILNSQLEYCKEGISTAENMIID